MTHTQCQCLLAIQAPITQFKYSPKGNVTTSLVALQKITAYYLTEQQIEHKPHLDRACNVKPMLQILDIHAL